MDSTARTSELNLSVSRQLSGLMSREEFFAALFILGCLNGLGSQIIYRVRVVGWTNAFFSTFGISAIVWIACFIGVRLILRERTGKIRPLDLILGLALLPLITLPIGALSWLAITIFSLYVLLSTDPLVAKARGAHSAGDHCTHVVESFTVSVFRQFHLGNRRFINRRAIGDRTYGQYSSLCRSIGKSGDMALLFFVGKCLACFFDVGDHKPGAVASFVPQGLVLVLSCRCLCHRH
jgi:hypothetical protein